MADVPILTPSATAKAVQLEEDLLEKTLTPPASKRLTDLINLSIAFLGINFAWSIQMGQMGPLQERLGASPEIMGWIAAAGPVTGVLVQPIVGTLSDRFKGKFGRRRPFMLVGALCAMASLFLMPHSPTLLIAALLLWILDASLNLSQGPYRALVPDVVPRQQQATAYSLMSLTIGLGSVLAFAIASQISETFTLFNMGAVVILLAMLWTIFTTPETPAVSTIKTLQPPDNFLKATLQSIAQMPMEAKKLCLAHSVTWFGLACMFFYFSVFVPHHIFGASSPTSPLYQQGVQWASACYAVMNTVCFLASALMSRLTSQGLSKKLLHSFGLLAMATGLVSMFFLTTPLQVMIAMGLVGIGWATTLSIPFALLSDHVPPGKEGVLMGTFNVFIAAPQVIASLFVGKWVMMAGNNFGVAMIIGGVAMVVSTLLLQGVKETQTAPSFKQEAA